MKCLNLIRRHGKTLLPLLAFLALPIFSLGFFSESVSALDKEVFVLNSSNNVPRFTYLCYNNESSVGVNCSDYSYLKISFIGSYNSLPSSSSIISLNFTGSRGYQISFSIFPVFDYIVDLNVFNLESDLYAIFINDYLSSSSNFDSGWSLTFTFLDSLSPDSPSGSLFITENGTYDVSSYTEAVVEVPDTETIIQGDYHDDLVDIKNIALVAIAVALFICFGRLILGMFMGVRR